MRTTYEKLAKNGIDHWIFGKAKKRHYGLFWLLIAAIITLGILL